MSTYFRASEMKMGRRTSPMKRRFLILIYLLCSVFTLTPTIIAPPERSFNHGQPEMYQAMDNTGVYRERVIKKGVQLPNGVIKGYPALLTYKINYLLSEAEEMLSSVKSVEERRWVGSFIQRLKYLSEVLEKSIYGDYKEIDELSFTSQEPLPTFYTVPIEENPIPPTSSPITETAVPETGQTQQDDKMASKQPETLLQTNEVFQKAEESAERQAVEKTGLLQSNPEKKSDDEDEDELVKELEDLRKLRGPVPWQINYKDQKAAPAKTGLLKMGMPEEVSSETDRKIGPLDANDMAIERRKAELKEMLAREVAELERLGGTEVEILSALLLNDQRIHGPMQPIVSGQKPEVGNADVANEKIFPNLEDVNSNDRMISKINKNIWKPMSVIYPVYKQVHMNNSIEGRPINLTPVNQKILERQFMNRMHKYLPRHLQLYQDKIRSTIQKLQKQHEKFFKNQEPMQKDPQQNPLNPLDNKYQENPAFGQRRPNPVVNYNYKPYPYYPSFKPKNVTDLAPEGMVDLPPESFAHHNISNELSDEMKRELRDGKVILLSDSEVKSNFGPETGNPKEAPIKPDKKKDERKSQE